MKCIKKKKQNKVLFIAYFRDNCATLWAIYIYIYIFLYIFPHAYAKINKNLYV